MSIRSSILKARNEELAGPFEDLELLLVSQTVGTPVKLKGGQYAIRTEDIGGDSVAIQIASPDDTWLSINDGIDTSDDSNVYTFGRGTILRQTVSVNTPISWISTVKRS